MPLSSVAAEAPSPTASALESVHIPNSFCCPITQDVMTDPVVTVDGTVYERASIDNWFQRGHNTSPLTGLPLPSLALTSELPLRRAIEEYMASRPEIARKELNHDFLKKAAETLEAEFKAKAKTAEAEIEVLKGRAVRAETALRGAEVRAERADTALRGAEVRAERAETALQEAEETIANLVTIAETAKTALQEADAKIVSLQTQAERAERAEAALRRQAESAETELQKAHTTIVNLQTRARRAEAALPAASSTATTRAYPAVAAYPAVVLTTPRYDPSFFTLQLQQQKQIVGAFDGKFTLGELEAAGTDWKTAVLRRLSETDLSTALRSRHITHSGGSKSDKLEALLSS